MASIRKRGKRYFAEVRRHGQALRKSFDTAGEAKAWARKKETEIDEGQQFGSSTKTLAWLIDAFLDANGDDMTKDDKARLEFWKQRLGSRKLIDLHRDDFVQGQDALSKRTATRGPNIGKPISTSRVDKFVFSIAAAFTWGMNKHSRHVTANPARIPALTKANSNRRDPLKAGWTMDTLKPVLAACITHPCPTLYPFVRIALATGARASELQNLRWGDVLFEEDRATLHFYETKNGEDRSIPIMGEPLRLLREWERDHRRIGNCRVFYNPSTARPGKYNYQQHWIQAKKTAQAENLRFHDLRHLAASHWVQQGIDLGRVAAGLGHRSLVMTKRYSHYDSRSLDSLAEISALC